MNSNHMFMTLILIIIIITTIINIIIIIIIVVVNCHLSSASDVAHTLVCLMTLIVCVTVQHCSWLLFAHFARTGRFFVCKPCRAWWPQ